MFQNFFGHKNLEIINYEERREGVKPSILLLHYTGMESADAAFARLSDPESKVSAHYLVYEDGKIVQMVDESMRAWHAGVSYWAGETDINSLSIGIEIVNPGHEFGYRPFPDVQMQAVLGLSRAIMGRHQINVVLAHSDVAPERKTDPGELFDWKYLAAHGVGLWPLVSPEDRVVAERISKNDFELEKMFVAFGYNPIAAFTDVVTAFQRHYYPEVFQGGAVGQVCSETAARLVSLLRLRASGA